MRTRRHRFLPEIDFLAARIVPSVGVSSGAISSVIQVAPYGQGMAPATPVIQDPTEALPNCATDAF
jgi:hypothetical protein